MNLRYIITVNLPNVSEFFINDLSMFTFGEIASECLNADMLKRCTVTRSTC